MSDQQGERQARQQAFVPTESTPVLSEDALGYVDSAAALQAAAATNPTYNGADAARRLLRGSDG